MIVDGAPIILDGLGNCAHRPYERCENRSDEE